VHIVGGDTPRGRLKRALERPSVTLVGHQDDATDEFLAADVLVVPTPIKLGTRVRIAVSFSYGCPVVAHEANGLGMPELVHDDNILFGKTGADLADGILRVLGDAAVKRRLEERAHETFTQHYAPPASVGRMLEIADSIAGSKRPTTAG
jgi:glycosyltransferase involved in cell wall biosynthesis